MMEHLKTQTQIKKYTQKQIQKIGICNDIKTEHYDFYDFCTNFLFPRHYNYPLKFIDLHNIGIRKNKVFKNFEVYIIKNDGTIEDVSVLKHCITGKNNDKLTQALRNSIYPQILDFKNSCKSLACVICGSYTDPHIDHCKPQFIELKNYFISNIKEKIPTEFDNNTFNGKIFRKEDELFEKKWNEYHAKNATLRVLCKKCNLSRKKAKK